MFPFNLLSFLILLFSVYMFVRGFFNSSTIMKLQIASYHIFIAFYLTPHQIIWHNKTIHGHGLKITSCWFFFFISEETKFHVDTTSIVLSYLYHFGNVNRELFWYYYLHHTINHARKAHMEKLIKFSSKFRMLETRRQ